MIKDEIKNVPSDMFYNINTLNIDKITDHLILNLRAQGYTVGDISACIGRSKRLVQRRVKELNIKK